jgi:hypothetical protein
MRYETFEILVGIPDLPLDEKQSWRSTSGNQPIQKEMITCKEIHFELYSMLGTNPASIREMESTKLLKSLAELTLSRPLTLSERASYFEDWSLRGQFELGKNQGATKCIMKRIDLQDRQAHRCI